MLLQPSRMFATVCRKRSRSLLLRFAALGSVLLSAGGEAARADGKQEGISYAKRSLPAVRLPAEMKPPVIDGDLSDPAWQRAAKADTFVDPQNGKPVADQTEAYLLYDRDFIYVGFYCHDSKPETIVARETVRDATMLDDDTVEVDFDPFLNYRADDYTIFAVNPLGTRRARIGGGRAGKVEWQGDWDAAAKRVPDGWIAEMRIPWPILPYPRTRGAVTMGVNLQRVQQRTRIQSVWSDYGPQRFTEYQGLWKGVEPPGQGWRPRFSALPYVLPIGQGEGRRSQIRVGLDARYQPTPELTSVATLNPDFTSVEGAVESIAFSRSERFVPDRRPFFVEGQDYLNFGQPYDIGSYFNSARITRVDGGFKLYGKLTPQTTLGMLSTIAVGHETNFVAQVHRDFSATANINAMFVQRVASGEDNSVLAVGPQFRSGKWSVDAQAALTAGPDAGGIAWMSDLILLDKNLLAKLQYRSVDVNYLDRLGFNYFTNYQGWTAFLQWGGPWRNGFFRKFDFTIYPTWDWHRDGSPFRRQVGGALTFETRSDYSFGFHANGGKFDKDNDFTYGVTLGGNITNRFRRWTVDFTTGTQANRPYTSLGLGFSVRIFRKLDLALATFLQNFDGVSQQHILTFNYELSPSRAWGGRMVIENSHLNLYLSYRRSGLLGTDTYFILGDPNARRFTRQLMMKFVFAL